MTENFREIKQGPENCGGGVALDDETNSVAFSPEFSWSHYADTRLEQFEAANIDECNGTIECADDEDDVMPAFNAVDADFIVNLEKS